MPATIIVFTIAVEALVYNFTGIDRNHEAARSMGPRLHRVVCDDRGHTFAGPTLDGSSRATLCSYASGVPNCFGCSLGLPRSCL
ncbi:hypothetical protein L6164_032344 [Bauhinia variegata]|uniref:Uncharacterized protein n=1 Tax=Bauhinia variegata TaxID=167791 RepID=A0ACB9KNJ7_BAUVA|nr:hypothetical protein L6164_032344 [Bauhinia variegata]